MLLNGSWLMSIRRTLLAAVAVFGLIGTALAQPADIPQTQMGAAAIVMGQVTLRWSNKVTVQITDDYRAHISHIQGMVPGNPFVDELDVIKVDDCHFNVVRSLTELMAQLN